MRIIENDSVPRPICKFHLVCNRQNEYIRQFLHLSCSVDLAYYTWYERWMTSLPWTHINTSLDVNTITEAHPVFMPKSMAATVHIPDKYIF